jgi:rhamnogalacturonyl hydrolase YesR
VLQKYKDLDSFQRDLLLLRKRMKHKYIDFHTYLMASTRQWLLSSLIVVGMLSDRGDALQCPTGYDIRGLGGRMIDSSISRGQGLAASNASTGFIEQGIFQQSVRESIVFYTNNTAQTTAWKDYLRHSLESAVNSLSNATAAAALPLDRLSIGTNMIHQYLLTKDATFLPAISALSESVLLQPKNGKGGLWYYANQNNISAYQNLSYIDGMYSYPAFALIASPEITNDTAVTQIGDDFGAVAALRQLEILRNITQRADGLLLHGYDAINNHSWANPLTGASPVIWARAQAWYTSGILEVLELMLAVGRTDETFNAIKIIFTSLVRAQVAASKRSLARTCSYGVWQVVDQPGASFDGNENFVEASSSCMTAYAMLKAVRLGILEDEELSDQASEVGLGIYTEVLQGFLIDNGNNTLSLNGTSSVASLSGDVSPEVRTLFGSALRPIAMLTFSPSQYYVTRPTVLNGLIGTSAFTLASLEVERVCLIQHALVL